MATLKEIRIHADGLVEAFYWFIDAHGERQDAAMRIDDDVSALTASAAAKVQAAVDAVTTPIAAPHEIVAAVTKLGDTKAKIAQAEREHAQKAAALAELDRQIAEKQAALAAPPPKPTGAQ